jgi:hypothetical protein
MHSGTGEHRDGYRSRDPHDQPDRAGPFPDRLGTIRPLNRPLGPEIRRRRQIPVDLNGPVLDGVQPIRRRKHLVLNRGDALDRRDLLTQCHRHGFGTREEEAGEAARLTACR